ncbi:BID domain-containing T4SS effector [Bartonella sp. cb54]|uniref:BID domain-containing T4SS effector n=1 Tax=Bartonella sp. cb54 TaxID=3385560 RepID=UPI0039A6B088
MRRSTSLPNPKIEASRPYPLVNYHYPNNVLKNKYGLTDAQALEERRTHDIATAVINLRQQPPPNKINSEYLMYLHHCMFAEAYEWAGIARSIPFIMRDGSTAYMPKMEKEDSDIVFAEGDDIQKKLQELDNVLAEKNYLKNLSRTEFVHEAATIFTHLYKIHPFIQGNTLTQQMFFEKLAEQAGHQLDFSLVTPERMQLSNSMSITENEPEYVQWMLEDISHPKKANILREFKHHMENEQHIDLQECLVVAVGEGEIFTGIYKGAYENSFSIKINDNHIVGHKDQITPEQLKTWKIGEKVTFRALMDKKIEQVFIPKEDLAPLTTAEITTKIAANAFVQQSRQEVNDLVKLVYGNPHALQTPLNLISEDPKLGERLSKHIMENPQSIHSLAGFTAFGVKNQERKEAEDHIEQLCYAVANYVDVVKNVKRDITHAHKAEKYRLAKQVNMPSEELKKALLLPKEEQQKVFAYSTTLRRELHHFSWQINDRLSIEERQAINQGDYQKIAETVGISMDKAKEITTIGLLAKEVSREQAQDIRLNRPKGLAMAS